MKWEDRGHLAKELEEPSPLAQRAIFVTVKWFR